MRWFSAMLLLVAAGCTRDNGAYCDPARPCASGSTCNLATNQCESLAGDMSVDDLGNEVDLLGADLFSACSPACQGVAPICLSTTTCAGCDTVGDGELACSTLTTGTPHCQPTGPSQGACVACRTSSDCSGATPGCDPAAHVCRTCLVDSDCPSKVCDLTPQSATQYQCVPQNQVIYVDKVNGVDTNNGLTPATAVARIQVGIMKAGPANATTIRIANAPGAYYDQDNVDLNNVDLTLVGETGAAIRPMGNNNPAIKVHGGAHVVLRNLIFTQGAGANGDGIDCETTGTGSLGVYDCTSFGNLQYGIDANICSRIDVERSWIGGSSVTGPNMAGGIRVGQAFHVANNFIIKNGNISGPSGGGVQINSPTNSALLDFTNNTIADNTGSGVNGGANCMNAVTIKNNIFYNNKTAGVAAPSETNCGLSYCASDDARDVLNPTGVNLSVTAPGFIGGDDYHLQPTSPCIGKGTATGVPAYDYDRQLRITPKTGLVDIGADEVE